MVIAANDPICARLASDLDEAFPDLVVDHQQLVFGVAARVVGESTAEDVAQEVFVRAYRALKRYPDERIRELRLRPWLARMALNAALNSIRGHRYDLDVADVGDAGPTTSEGPHQRAERNEERRM